MRTSFRFLVLVLAASLAVFPLAGCGKVADEVAERAAEEMLEGATGVEVDVEDDGESITITGDDGEETTIESGDSASVPDAYPDDFPLYDGDIVGSSSISSGEDSMVMVTVETGDDLGDIKAFLEAGFEDNGWTIASLDEMTASGVTNVNYMLTKSDPAERSGMVSIMIEDGVTVVTHTVFMTTD
jgi:hypothetical protein